MHKNTIQEKTNTTSNKNGDLQSIGDDNGDDVMMVHSELSEVYPRPSLSPSDQAPPPRDHPPSSHRHPQEYQSDAVCVCVSVCVCVCGVGTRKLGDIIIHHDIVVVKKERLNTSTSRIAQWDNLVTCT